jgi:ferritin-like metal-binding protein YciE
MSYLRLMSQRGQMAEIARTISHSPRDAWGGPNRSAFNRSRENPMALETLHDLWVHELKDLYSAERQLVQALPKMAKAATSEELRTALENHLAETEEQAARIEQILESFDESPRGQKCAGMEGLIEEGKDFLKEEADDDVLDAGIIVNAQKVEHYEIATYGAVVEYARMMGHTDALQLLEQTLQEEKNADQLLNQLAEGGINALAERDNNNEEMGEDEAQASETTARKSTARGGMKKSSGRSRSSKARN